MRPFARSSRRSIRDGIFNPGKIVDAPPLTANLRYGRRIAPSQPDTFFDYSEHGGLAGAVEMCSGLGACRKKLDGTMCPSYMATRDEAHSTRGRANVLRLAMAGRLGEAGPRRRGCSRRCSICASNAAPARPSVRSASTWRGSRASSSPTTGAGTARRCARACSDTSTICRAGAAGLRRCRTSSRGARRCAG